MVVLVYTTAELKAFEAIGIIGAVLYASLLILTIYNTYFFLYK